MRLRKAFSLLSLGTLVGLSVSVLLPATDAGASCGPHRWVEEYPHITKHAGTGVGVTAGNGLYLGAINVDCARVTSVIVFWDVNNQEEIGAIQETTDYFNQCPHPPTDSQWYRFWVKVYTGTWSCTSSYARQGVNTYHEADIRRDNSNFYSWHLYWNGSLWTTLTGSKTSGIAMANAERGVSTDSIYSEYDGMQYRTTDGAWHTWGSLLCWLDNDADYDLVTTSSPSHFYVKITNSGYTC